MNVTDTERKAIIRRTAAALGQLQEGEDAISVLSRIYCQNLPDKSPRQGTLMAEELLSWMGRFRQAIDSAQEDPEAYAHRALAEQLADLSLEQQCQVLRRQIHGCIRMETSPLTEEAVLAELEPEEAADPQTQTVSETVRDALLQEAACRIAGEKQMDICGGRPEDSAAVYRSHSITKACVGEDMLQAVTAMVIYTMVKNGELSGLPEDTSLGQIVVGVCAQEQYREILVARENGYLPEEEVRKRQRTLFTVLALLLLAAAVAIAGGVLWAHSKGTDIVSCAALGLYILLWLSIMLGIYYHASAEMVQEDPETIAQIPLEWDLAEAAEYRKDIPDEQTDKPWSEREHRRENQKETAKKKQQLKL